MSELSQTGERGRELTAEEWEKVDKLVDKTGCSYYGARWALGFEPPADQNAHALMSDYLIRISPRIRNYGLNAVVLIRARNKHMKHRDRAR